MMAVLASTAVAAAGAVVYLDWESRGRDTELILYGNVDIREVDLAFNTKGRIERMLVEEGDRVQKGALLAELDASRYRAQANAARAQVRAQQAVLDRLLAGSRPEEIRKAQEDVHAIEAEFEDARATLDRVTKLAADKFTPQQRLDDVRAVVRTLEAKLEAARQVLALVIKGPRAEEIVEARAMLEAEKARLALLEEELKDAKLYAKDDGIVRTRILEPGAVVLPNTPVYTISLSDPVWVRTYISGPDLGRIRPGMKASVFTDSAPDRAYAGWVGFISSVAEFTPKTVETPRLRDHA